MKLTLLLLLLDLFSDDDVNKTSTDLDDVFGGDSIVLLATGFPPCLGYHHHHHGLGRVLAILKRQRKGPAIHPILIIKLT